MITGQSPQYLYMIKCNTPGDAYRPQFQHFLLKNSWNMSTRYKYLMTFFRNVNQNIGQSSSGFHWDWSVQGLMESLRNFVSSDSARIRSVNTSRIPATFALEKSSNTCTSSQIHNHFLIKNIGNLFRTKFWRISPGLVR